ncbi:transcriptional repressor, partial [Bifidobacteriaceae bacterium VN003]
MSSEPMRRHTKQKEIVLSYLRESRNFVSAQDLHRILAKDG